jgi:hypothetical protein
MSRYILDGVAIDESVITNDNAFPLVREIAFKYGLKVFRTRTKEQYGYAHVEFVMSFSNGVPVCKVWAEKDSSGVLYHYRSPYYQKERGRDSADRETLRSLKLSTLMGSLKKNKVVPTLEYALRHVKDVWDSAIYTHSASFGSCHKDTGELTPDMIHALVRSYLGESPSTPNYILDRSICKKLLDKYNNVDKIRAERELAIEQAYGNPFYVIGADGAQTLIVAKIKRVMNKNTSPHGKEFEYEIVEDFKRVPNLDEYPELLSITTMFKASTEGRFDSHHVYGGFIPRANQYYSDLDVSTVCRILPDDFNFAWMLIPCSQT